MLHAAPIGVLRIHKKEKDALIPGASEPIYGGYSNGRGEVSLFGETIVYRVNFKNGTVRQHPPLNSGAQVHYDAADSGETFAYCNVEFRRLSNAEIVDICSSGSFRVTPRAA